MPRRQVWPISTGRLRIQATKASPTARRSQPPAGQQRPAERKAHLRVVGDLAGLEAQPTAPDNLAVYR